MLQVKIIRAPATKLETEINLFLQNIGSQPGYRISVPDIKLVHIGGQNDVEEALIIYNAVAVNTEPSAPTKR